MAALVAGVVLAPGAGAAVPVVEALDRVSGPPPFPASCTPSIQPLPSDAAGEPRLAVDPRDPQTMVLVYGQLPSVVAMSSRDGGRSWTRTLPPGLSKCTGGTTDFTGDPFVTIGADGTFYMSSVPVALPVPNTTLFPRSWIAVNRSFDHGASWSAPTMVSPDDGSFWDKGAITADPRLAGVAHEAFIKRIQPDGSGAYVARTSDGGASFSEPLQNVPDQQLTYAHAPQIVVVPDGTLVEVFVQFNDSDSLPAAAQFPVPMMSMYSRDSGAHWSTPLEIAQTPNPSPTDPDTGQQIDAVTWPSTAAGPDGAVYATWTSIASAQSAQIVFSKSVDGARTWSAPSPVAAVAAQAWSPTIAVNADGTVGVTWYDARRDRRGDGRFTTDVWFADSGDGGDSWRQIHLAGPFDYLTAAQRNGRPFMGDYYGLAPVPQGFVAAFAQAQPQSGGDHSAVFFARIRVAAAPESRRSIAGWLPSSRRCRSTRRLVIRPRPVSGESLRDAIVLVNGRRVRILRGRGLIRPIELARLPSGRFTVTIVAHTRSGRTIRTSRTYRTCRARQHRHRAQPRSLTASYGFP
jgi:hypothetical protein